MNDTEWVPCRSCTEPFPRPLNAAHLVCRGCDRRLSHEERDRAVQSQRAAKEEALGALAAWREMLLAIEWEGDGRQEHGRYCPVCWYQPPPGAGHSADCEIGTTLSSPLGREEADALLALVAWLADHPEVVIERDGALTTSGALLGAAAALVATGRWGGGA